MSQSETFLEDTRVQEVVEVSEVSAGTQEEGTQPRQWGISAQKGLYALALILTVIASLVTILSVRPLELAVLIIVVIVLSVVLGVIIYFYRSRWTDLKNRLDSALARMHRHEAENSRLTRRVLELEADCERLIGETGSFTGEVESLQAQLDRDEETIKTLEARLQKSHAKYDELSEEHEQTLEELRVLTEGHEIKIREIEIRQEKLRLERENMEQSEVRRLEDRRVTTKAVFEVGLYTSTDEESGRKGRYAVLTNISKNMARKVSTVFSWKRSQKATKIRYTKDHFESLWKPGKQRRFWAGMEDEVGSENRYVILELEFENLYGDKEKESFAWAIDRW